MMSLMRLFERVQGIKILKIGLTIFFFLALSDMWTSEVKAQTYPTRPITLIYPWPAGAVADIFSRGIAPQLKEKLGAPVETVTKPGGSATIGTLEVMRARPDGYTLLLDVPGSSSIQKAWMTELPYRVEERTFIAYVGFLPTAIVVRSDYPWKNLMDVEQAIRRDPASIRWPMCGTSHPEVAMGLFRAALTARGINLSQTKKVPFQGASQAYIALAGGHVDIYSGSIGGTGALIEAGKLRAIAVASNQRVKFFPGVPTTGEQGFPNVVANMWIGITGPPRLPEIVVRKWIDAMSAIVKDPAMVPTFDKLGIVPDFLGGDDFRKFVMNEAEIIKGIGLVK